MANAHQGRGEHNGLANVMVLNLETKAGTEGQVCSQRGCSCQVALQLAGLGIAVANAGAPAKAAADVVLEETNDQDAVAKAIEKFVLSQA